MPFEGPENIKPEGYSRKTPDEIAWEGIKRGLMRGMGEYLRNKIEELKRTNNLPDQATLREIEQSDSEGFAAILREFGIKYRNTGEEITRGAIEIALKNFGLVDPQELDQESERLWKIISQQEESSGKSPEEPQNE